MAVVQISKIQQRRGQKLLTGMPQLSSAELAWAVDTQELYIGNGSLAEGAPYVGNTRVLTEHDNILELAGTYRFAEPDVSITASIDRSFQGKLDEMQVSILDFGPMPAPSIDHSVYFATAFEQLFQNVDQTFRKVLVVPNGNYTFTTVLKIPSNVIIRGETRDGVVLDVGSTGIEFISANNTEAIDFDTLDRPENFQISNLTIYYTTGATNITGLKDSAFSDVTWKSDYVLGDVVSTPVLASQSYELSGVGLGGNFTVTGSGISVASIIKLFDSDAVTTIESLVTTLNADGTFYADFIATRSAESLIITARDDSGISAAAIATFFTITLTANGSSGPAAITPTPTSASSGIDNTAAAVTWTNTDFGYRTNDVHFHSCRFESVPLGIKCLQETAYQTVVNFTDCEFFVCDTGIYVQGVGDTQNNDWAIDDCKFEEIAKQAIYSTSGYGINVHRAKFKNVGNGVNGPAYPEYPIAEFGTKHGNILVDCYSDRHQNAGLTLLTTTVGFSEALNGGVVDISNDHFAELFPSSTFYPLAVFSALNRYINIDYVITLSNVVRKGVLTLVIDDTLSDIAIADNYTYSPSLITDPGGPMITSFEFNAELKDNNSDSDIDTVLLTYKNPMGNIGDGSISYSISYGV